MSFNGTYVYDFIFCGGSFAAAGAAVRLADEGKRVLLLESARAPGSEYTLAYRGGKIPCDAAASRAAELCGELRGLGAVTSDGRIDHTLLSPALSRILMRRGDRISFFPSSVPLSAEKTLDGWRVCFVTNGVRHTAEAGRLVGADLYDALGGGASGHIKKKYLIGLALCESEKVVAGELPGDASLPGGCRVTVDGDGGDVTMTFSFDAAANMCTARRAVRSYVTGGSFAASGLRLAALADEFAVESDEESVFYGDGYARLAPVRFADAVSAYGDGVLFAERLDGETCGRAPRIRASECKSAGEYDLIVAGLGAAGSIAAITAARLGLRVFAIERGSQPGGVGTSGGIYTYYLGYGGGIYCEADGLAAKLGENGFARERGCGLLTKGMALDAMLDSCGADVVYGASVCGVLHDTDDTERIDGVIFRTGAGFFAARAPLTIDSTADSAVGLLAGCTMLGGRESDGEFQLFSNVSCFLNRENGCAASENCDDGTVDQYDPADLGIKTLASEAAGPHLGKRYADARYRRLGTVPYLGVREGLRIKGIDTMTLERAASCPTDKAIFFELANLDSHAKDFPFESRGYRDVVELCSLWDCRISIPVTKGCLIPAGVHGLIAAGRNISTDHDIALACRMMRAMQKCGEAAGVIAYLAHRDGTDPHNVSDAELRDELIGRNVLDPAQHYAMYFYTADPATRYKKDILELTADEIAAMLALDAPGAAVYACSVNRKLGSDALVRMLDDPASRRGDALALAVRGENAAARDVLIGMIRDKSGEMPCSSHTFCLPYAVSAMSAAGKCGMTEALPALLDIVCDPDYAADIPNLDKVEDKTKLICDGDDVKYLYFVGALGAVYDIYRAYPDAARRAVAERRKPDVKKYVTGASMIGRTDGVRNSSGKIVRRMIDELWK